MNAFWIEQVEAFLEGKISRTELDDIARREGIQNVEQEIEWLRDSRIAIEATGLRTQLAEVLPQRKKSNPQSRPLAFIRPALAIAATITALILAFVWWNQDPAVNLYAQYEFKDPGLPVLMSQSDEYNLYDAMTYYSEENYQEAIDKLTPLLQQSPDNDTLAYYLGASRLYLGQSVRAEDQLLKISEDSEFVERAQWLLVLTALQSKDYEAANNYSQVITSADQHPFYEQAIALQEQLKTINN